MLLHVNMVLAKTIFLLSLIIPNVLFRVNCEIRTYIVNFQIFLHQLSWVVTPTDAGAHN